MVEEKVIAPITLFTNIPDGTLRALHIAAFIMRIQLFNGYNISTAMLSANHILVSGGCGVLSIPVEDIHDVTVRLISFYSDGDYGAFVTYLRQYVREWE